mmetsp:Transcript_24835/g.46421  ORF Transcript_24835/g.46421 Transcript_24835/m.46421 type:complete len:247 (-) Transcript_24835:1456-2196(-)
MVTLVSDYRNLGGKEIADAFVKKTLNITKMFPRHGCVEEYYPLYALTRHHAEVEFSSRMIYVEWEPWRLFTRDEYKGGTKNHPAEFLRIKKSTFQRLRACSVFMRKITRDTRIVHTSSETENLLQFIRREVLKSKYYMVPKREAIVLNVGNKLSNASRETMMQLENLNRLKYIPYIFYEGERLDGEFKTRNNLTLVPLRQDVLDDSSWLLNSAKWLAGQGQHDFAWFIEGDVVFNVTSGSSFSLCA